MGPVAHDRYTSNGLEGLTHKTAKVQKAGETGVVAEKWHQDVRAKYCELQRRAASDREK